MAQFQTNLLFWNIRKQQPTSHIVALVEHYDVDILLLAESGYDSLNAVTNELNRTAAIANTRFVSVFGTITPPLVGIISRIKPSNWKLMIHRSRYEIWRVKQADSSFLYLAIAHFPDVRNEQGDGQRKSAIDLRMDINFLEQNLVSHQPNKGYEGIPLLVIGDLNASPFDPGIAGVYGLNATSRRAVARAGAREMDDIFYPFMYNLMWQFFGASDNKAPGTFYKRLSKPICYDWYILDQVLVRPKLLSAIKDTDVKILEHTGLVTLVGSDHRPNTKISDHLPILVTIHA